MSAIERTPAAAATNSGDFYKLRLLYSIWSIQSPLNGYLDNLAHLLYNGDEGAPYGSRNK